MLQLSHKSNAQNLTWDITKLTIYKMSIQIVPIQITGGGFCDYFVNVNKSIFVFVLNIATDENLMGKCIQRHKQAAKVIQKKTLKIY